MSSQKIWIWRRADTGTILGPCAFATKDAAERSMHFSCRNMAEKPRYAGSDRDVVSGLELDVWDSPAIEWTRYTLAGIDLLEGTTHL